MRSDWRHAPPDYRCPMCRLLIGDFNDLNAASDIVTAEPSAFARISPKYWVNQPGNVLVCPTAHLENLYEMDEQTTTAVFDMVRRTAIAMRSSYDCDGVSIRQHNEPAGDQDVWHLHVHVLPRRRDDQLYLRHHETRILDTHARADWADRLRSALAPGT